MNKTPPRVVAIIQARMSSSRCPGKMLQPVNGKPLIDRVIERSCQIGIADEVVLATSDESSDDALAQHVSKQSTISVFRGSLNNVLQRYIDAAERSRADIVVRVCGDSCLFDPDLVSRGVDALIQGEGDLLLWNTPTGGWAHQGICTLTLDTLRWSAKYGHDNPRAYEHVSAYAIDRHQELKTVTLPAEKSLLGPFKLTVDYPEDLELIDAIYHYLEVKQPQVPLSSIVELIRSNPEIAALHQRSLMRGKCGDGYNG